MRKILFPVLCSWLVITAVSCTKAKEYNRTFYHTILAGSNEVPGRATGGYGDASGYFDNETKVLTLTIHYDNLRAPLSAWHIHKAAAGVNGGVIFNFGTPQPSGFIFVSPPFTPEQEADLANGLNYVNLHTSVFPGGEIRGQLRKN
jgi:CHRD domain